MANATLIISFYNKIDQLLLILKALELQTYKEFEIIIADDGSKKDVVQKLNHYISSSELDLLHVWHDDIGFRKTKILNMAVVASRSDYLIFIDGDCIPHSRFVEEHIANREENTVLAGKRANLPQKISKNITIKTIEKRRLEQFYFFYFLFGIFLPHERLKLMKNGFYFKNKWLRRITNKKKKGILGSNFSLYKSDLLNINGFDERYIRPAVGEDSDIDMRLVFNGVKIKTVKHIAVQYHLYHKTLPREEANMVIYNDNLNKRVIYTPYGIKKDKTDGHQDKKNN